MRTPVAEPDVSRAERAIAPARLVSATWRTATVLLLAALLAGAAAGILTWRAEAAPSEQSAEVGFSRDMIQHHQQAVTMSFLVRDRTQDPEVRGLAMDIVTGQSEEMGMLTAWLRRHDVPASSTEPAMGWMGTAAEDGHGAGHVMPDGETTAADMGMASDDDLARLARLEGRAAEVQFLELMGEHHRGALPMIEGYLELGSDDELRRIAEGMLTAQTREVRIMNELLDARGA